MVWSISTSVSSTSSASSALPVLLSACPLLFSRSLSVCLCLSLSQETRNIRPCLLLLLLLSDTRRVTELSLTNTKKLHSSSALLISSLRSFSSQHLSGSENQQESLSHSLRSAFLLSRQNCLLFSLRCVRFTVFFGPPSLSNSFFLVLQGGSLLLQSCSSRFYLSPSRFPSSCLLQRGGG